MSDRKKPNPADYYDIFAPTYDEVAESHDWPAKQAGLLASLKGRLLPQIDALLDLGAGTGHTLAGTLQATQPSKVIAVDISSEMLKRLKDKHPSPQVETVCADVAQFVSDPNINQKYDLVTAMSFLEFVPTFPKLTREIGRLLGDKGVYAFTYLPHEGEGIMSSQLMASEGLGASLCEHRWAPEVVGASLAEGGMSVIHREPVEAYRLGEEAKIYNFVVAQRVN